MVFSVLLPFLIGCGIAFVLNIPMRGIEQGIFKNEKNRLYRFRRPISMVLTYIAALLFIALVLFVVVPEVADTVGKVKELLPGFVNRVKELALAHTKNVPAVSEKIAEIEPDFDQIFSFFNDNGGEIMSATVSIFSSIIGTVVNIFSSCSPYFCAENGRHILNNSYYLHINKGTAAQCSRFFCFICY